MAYLDLTALSDAQLAADLAAVQVAIAAARTSQSYNIGSRGLNRGALKDLYEERSSLSAEITQRGQTNGPAGIIEFTGPE